MADTIIAQDANANQADRIAPWTPSDEAWDGLARDIVMWHDCYANKLTPRTLFKHLDLVGTEVPQWLRDEPELQNLDHTISKGTRAVIIYRAMLQDAPAAPDLVAVARAYEAWEADLILNGDWSNDLPRMTQAQYDRLLEIQAMRNAALRKAGGPDNG